MPATLLTPVPTPSYDDLTEALVATGATLAFDATGGGKLASDILACMENAAGRDLEATAVYGKQATGQKYLILPQA